MLAWPPQPAIAGFNKSTHLIVDEAVLYRIDWGTFEIMIISSALEYDTCGFAANGDGITVTMTTAGRPLRSGTDINATQTFNYFPRN